jgi:RecA-family ATPase
MPDIMDDRWFDAHTRIATDRRLLILDTLRRFHACEENDSGAMAKVIGRMEAIAARTGCSIVFLHHSSKSAAMGGQGDQQQASRGSSVLVDNIRWQGFLAGMGPDEVEQYGIEEGMRRIFVRFGVSKSNYGAPRDDRWYRRHEGGVLQPAVLERKGKNKGGRNGYSG